MFALSSTYCSSSSMLRRSSTSGGARQTQRTKGQAAAEQTSIGWRATGDVEWLTQKDADGGQHSLKLPLDGGCGILRRGWGSLVWVSRQGAQSGPVVRDIGHGACAVLHACEIKP